MSAISMSHAAGLFDVKGFALFWRFIFRRGALASGTGRPLLDHGFLSPCERQSLATRRRCNDGSRLCKTAPAD